jgi:hypothetical protein
VDGSRTNGAKFMESEEKLSRDRIPAPAFINNILENIYITMIY